MYWVTLVFVLAALCACSYLLGRPFVRTVYLAYRIRGPSFWTVMTSTNNLITDRMLMHMCRISESYDFKPWGVWIYWNYAVFVSDPDSVKEVYRNCPSKSDLVYKLAEKYIGHGVFSVNGDDIKRQRRIILPSFRKNLIEANLPQVIKTAENLVQRMKAEAEKSVDLEKIVEDEVLDLAFWILTTGKYFINKDNRVVCRNMHKIMDTVQQRAMNPVYFWLVYNWKKSRREGEVGMKNLMLNIKKLVDEAKGEFEKKAREPDFEPKNLFESMMYAHLGIGGEKFSEEEFITGCVTLVIAAFETTAFTVHASMLLLALHADEQQKVFEEQQAIFGQSQREVEMEDLSKMTHLEYVLKETLRLFPPAPIIGKIAEKETIISGLLLPAGCSVLINNMALNRNPKYFANPNSFDPQRFAPENCAGRHAFAFNPFSHGPRNCPGPHQAFIAMKTIMSFIIRTFRIYPGEGLRSIDDIKVKMSVSLHLRRSLALRLVAR